MTAEATAAFAKRSEHITNENLAQDANQFLELTSKIIHKYGGDILQFLGNSLIALWNQPGETDLIISRRAV
jgi:class 3 adenylate cyclase